MATLHDGQCGLCKHFGEHHANDPMVVQIHNEAAAPLDYTDECGHPKHAPLHLQVTPVSGCDGFEAATGVPVDSQS